MVAISTSRSGDRPADDDTVLDPLPDVASAVVRADHGIVAGAREGATARGIFQVVEWAEAQGKPHIRLTMTS